MARGPAKAAQNQLNTTNALGAAAQTRANKLQDQLIPGYTSLMDTGYLSPADQAAATTSEMGTATAPFSSAEFRGANRASATRNPSNLAAEDTQLALEEGQTAGEAASNLQREKMQNQLQGMYGLGNISGENIQEAESMYGMAPSTINAWTNAAPGWVQNVEGLVNAFTGAGQKVSQAMGA